MRNTKYLKLLLLLILVFSLSLSVMAEEYSEAPILKEMVAEGRLEKIGDRLPVEPAVIEDLLIKEIGNYGGRLEKGTLDLSVTDYMYFDQSGVADGPMANIRGFFAERVYDPDKYGIVHIPRLAKGWEFSDNNKEFTLYLREGTKWSDGELFTAEDVKFSYEDIILDENVPYNSSNWIIEGEPIKLEIVDDYTIKFYFPKPMPLFLNYLDPDSPALALYPKHKLENLHPKYNPDAEYEDLVQARKADADFVPVTLGPWKVKKYVPGVRMELERNPYYWAVDKDNQQLPYIDEIYWTQYPERSSHVLAFMGGNLDLLEYNEGATDNFSTMMQRSQTGPFRVWLTELREGPAIYFNFDIEDPNLNNLFNNLDFRKALSYGIDREAMVRVFVPGRAEPHVRTFSPLNPYHNPDTVPEPIYDVKKANEMLDSLGLDDVDNDGFREFSDGSEISLILRTVPSRIDIFDMVKNFWEDIGIRLSLDSTREEMFYDIWQNGEFELLGDNGWGWSTLPLQRPDWWVASGEPGEPSTWHIVNNSWEVAQETKKLFDEAATISDFQERKEIMNRAETLISNNYQGLGTYATRRPQGASNRLKNVPIVNNRRLTYLYTYSYAYYIEE